MNTMKTTLLMTGLTLILIWASNAFGGQSGMTIALVFALIMNVGSYWFSDKIVLKMYKAQEVTEAAANVGANGCSPFLFEICNFVY